MGDWFRLGCADIRAALGLRGVWFALAVEDVSDQHRRTLLGPIWMLLSYLAFAGTFIVIFHRGAGVSDYAVYVGIGLFVWLYLLEVVSQSVTLFVREEAFIKGTTLPLTTYILRQSAQSVIRSGYALIGCLAIIFFSGHSVSFSWLWSGTGIALILLTTPAAVAVFAVAGAYFPDLQFVVSNIMRLGLFLTPIFWMDAGGGGIRSLVYRWNPFTYFLEIVRAPIYSSELPLTALGICGTISVCLWLAAIVLVGQNRKKIAYVL